MILKKIKILVRNKELEDKYSGTRIKTGVWIKKMYTYKD